MRTIRDRIYTDFVMPSRLAEYEAFLRRALAAGYDVLSIEAYWQRRGSGELPDRVLILRHDVDTDPGTASSMWAIDRALGVRASHFFRLSTLDIPLMREMASAGAEASYHYEEVATVARRRRPRTTEAATALLPEARERFAANLARLRRTTGLPMSIVASHGDFLNRRLGLNNWEILADAAFRAAQGIVLEPYDPVFLSTVTSYHRDAPPPTRWYHGDPDAAIERGEPVMYVLVHPRPWRVNRRVNLVDDLARLRDELAYRRPAG